MRPVNRVLLGLYLLIQMALVRAQEISWSAPDDGGTPRDPARIERLSPTEFRIRSAFEEGGQSVLRHAVSRVDLLARNQGNSPVKIRLHLDLSGDGKRTDYDTKPESGMRLRDFIFIQSASQDWKQVDGTTTGWVASVQFELPPGETKIGLSPWYTYRDYQTFMDGLPTHPHLQKQMVGKSDAGREHWELRITDPSATRPKETIFWQAREHAYETWSSLAMEGLVAFLLSDEAAEFRKNFVIVLHPMTNIDGVAQGYEYRGGYDFPDPRGTATGRLTFETADRLRPHYAVAWHNWVAPRDRNVVFYTDGENNKPSSRAWLRFTQLFPSLHASGHRWKDEAEQLRYNWEGRRPLSEANIHQYAMKKYGTRVWGWEMPWWNWTPNEVRQSGAQFGKAFLATLTEIRANAVPAAQEMPSVETPRWQMHEFAATGRTQFKNPFRDAALVGEFISPSGKTNVVDGFYDGADTWRLRFAPSELGEWRYQLRGEGVEILQRGKLICTTAQSKGFIRVHPQSPYAFAYDDGTPFFPMGDTCYGLLDDSPITPELRAEYLKTRRAQRFNFVRMHVSQSRPRGASDSTYWPWSGTTKTPDLDQLNPAFFQHLDGLFRQLRSNGMNVELILLNYYQAPINDPRLWTAERNRLWLRYIAARYGAFDNLFLWTLANEYETHPDGKYRLDYPADVEWAKASGRWMKESDPHRHLFTVHPVISASRQGESPRSPYDQPWRIGEFFGDDPDIDVLSQQTASAGEGTRWDEGLQCWIGDDKNLVASLRADRRYRKPVLNTENGYEYLRGQPTERKQVHHTDKVRRAAWRIAAAGGYFAAGFNGTIGHSDVWNRLDAPNHYTFVPRDEGAGAQLGYLYDVFNQLPFWRMEPVANLPDEIVGLTDSGRAFLIYFSHGGEISLSVPPASSARWFNPRENKWIPASAKSAQKWAAPDANDWALVVQPSPAP